MLYLGFINLNRIVFDILQEPSCPSFKSPWIIIRNAFEKRGKKIESWEVSLSSSCTVYTHFYLKESDKSSWIMHTLHTSPMHTVHIFTWYTSNTLLIYWIAVLVTYRVTQPKWDTYKTRLLKNERFNWTNFFHVGYKSIKKLFDTASIGLYYKSTTSLQRITENKQKLMSFFIIFHCYV